MNINTDMIKKNLLTILSAVALISMLFTFVSFTTESQYAGSNTVSMTGIQVCGRSIFASLLIIGPILLIVMNYIKQLEDYKGLLSIVVPCICLFALLLTYFDVKSVGQAASGAVENMGNAIGDAMEGMGVSMDVSVKLKRSIGFGTILAGVSYIAMIVFGIKTQKDFSLSNINVANLKNINVDNIKSAGADFINGVQNTVSKAVHTISENIPSSTGTHSEASPVNTASASKKHIDETLALIEKLAQMKDSGILTEQEFAEKKAKLLEDI